MSGKQRNIRTKRATSDLEEDAGDDQSQSLRDRMEETRLIQKQRKKYGGMDTKKLAVAGASSFKEVVEEEEPESASVANLMDSYVKATTVRETDEDPQMKKFVEMELAKRLGKRAAGEELDEGELRQRLIEQDLYSIPDHLQSVQQDVPIAGLMTGISEVTLPLEERLKRIEETEIVKRRMLAAASKRARLPIEEEVRKNIAEEKMKRSTVPIVFGKAEVRRCDRDQEEMEGQRRRVVTETRPMLKGGGRGRGK